MQATTQTNATPLVSFVKRPTMSAIVTTTSQIVETRIISNGNELDTKYFDTLDQAMNHLDQFQLDSIEVEELTI